ncbi:MAG: phosphotransferase [Nocardioides sp.]
MRLVDGRRLIVKRMTPASDLTLGLTGGTIPREYLLWQAGVLDRLPAGVTHAVIDAWLEGDTTILVMRDLGETVLTWDSRLSAARTDWVLARLAALHRRFLAEPPSDTVSLQEGLTLFAPDRLGPAAEQGNELARLARRGWEIFAETVPADVAAPVLALLDDVTPLAAALAAGPLTLAHGDLTIVNMAFDGDDLVLLDWALPMAAPGAVDVARLVAGCSSSIEPTREAVLASYARLAGPAHDERSLRLALLAGLLWLGWNKALDSAEHPDPAIREQERDDLVWWIRAVRDTLEKGDL